MEGETKPPMKTLPAFQKKEPKRRDAGTFPELRILAKLIDAFGDEFPFARHEVERIKTQMARVEQAARRDEARHRADHHKSRALLSTFFNGRIEKWIYASDNEEAKSHFKRVWRDGASPKPDTTGKATITPEA